ncbi:PQQ-binding-like beta-propeller repeat protein [Archangium violaceum]|uniref:PQQ-binding-like beta-propeller repeat protein n=1 Tax=Archangium violaceum TaxID=83451 RepID=UPI0009495CA2|nr:PQQ-binding-like beta-propeller repeat protein [Archangium violaceum]
MKRFLWVLGLLLMLGACILPDEQEFLEERARTCGQSFTCPEGSTCEEGFCVKKELDPSACTPACAPYQACTLSRICIPRYTALVVTPGDGGVVGAGPVPVRAELVVGLGFASNFPETLNFRVATSDGGTGGTQTAVSKNEGVYTTEWTPTGEGEYLLTVTHPEAGGPSTTVRLTVDTTGPTFVVFVPPSDAGVAAGGTTYGDPVPGFATAWRRDQVVPVEIRTNEPHLDVGTVTVALTGTDGGTTPAVAVTPLSGVCDAGFCGVAQLNLWEPSFNAFRGTMSVAAQGKDTVGNSGSGSENIDVTRWKWAFDGAAGAIRSGPAIGSRGTIYLGTANLSGKVFALTPAGALKWESQVGSVVGGPVVGASDGGTELVYVGANSTSDGYLYALQSGDGGTLLRCSMPVAGAFEGALALGTTSTAQSETAVSVYNGNSGASLIVGIRPGATLPCPVIESPSGGEQIPFLIAGSSVLMRGDTIFFAGSAAGAPKVTSYVFGATAPRSSWPVNAPTVTRSLVLVGSDVIAGAASSETVTGGLFKIPQAGAADVTRLYPAGTSWSSRVYSLAVGSALETPDNVFFGSEPTGSINFNRFNLTSTSLQPVSSNAAIRAAPVVGANGNVYTATTNGTVRALLADTLTQRWTITPGLGTVEASPTLDCPRDASGALVAGNHGVLYVPAGGKLYAFVVDSRGLDTSAPWPKYQHDSRNTGNPATPITGCP